MGGKTPASEFNGLPFPSNGYQQEFTASQQNFTNSLSGLLGAAQQGISASYQQGLQPLPYPYSNGYPVPGGNPLVPVPEPEVQAIASPMDSIVNPKPRKMRIHDEIL